MLVWLTVYLALCLHCTLAGAGTLPAIPPEQNPLRPPDTSSPRATLESLIDNMERAYAEAQESKWPERETRLLLRRAVRTLDLSDAPRTLAEDIGMEAALYLKEIIDRVGVPPLATVPDRQIVDDDELVKWRLPNTEIVIAKVDSGPRTGEWLFTPATVDQAQGFFERVEHLPYRPGATPRIFAAYSMTPGAGLSLYWAESLPRWLGRDLLGQTLWQWLAGLGALLLGLLLGVGLYRLGRRADKRRGSKSQSGDQPSRRGTILALVFALAVAIGVETVIDDVVNFTGGMLVLSSRLFVILTYALVGWVAVLLLTQIPEVIIRSRRLRPRGVDSQLLRLGFKLLALITIAALIIDGADKLGLPAYSVITGLGVGGLAVALAARETIANLLGSLAIMLDRPFRIGDWIRIGDDEGTVEDIGFRSTRIRTFYDSLRSIPNATTVNAAIDNMGQRQFRRVYTRLNLRYDTPPAQIEAFLEGCKAIIRANPATRKDYFHVVLNDYGPHSLSVMLYFFLDVPDWSVELVERQRVLIEVLRLARKLGLELAFPTQTLEVERLPGHPPTAVDPPADEELAAVAKSFGAGGSAARPRGLGLFTPPTEER